jgi:hypothetical protein
MSHPIPGSTATAEPLDDPPGSCRGSSGFTGVPAGSSRTIQVGLAPSRSIPVIVA